MAYRPALRRNECRDTHDVNPQNTCWKLKANLSSLRSSCLACQILETAKKTFRKSNMASSWRLVAIDLTSTWQCWATLHIDGQKGRFCTAQRLGDTFRLFRSLSSVGCQTIIDTLHPHLNSKINSFKQNWQAHAWGLVCNKGGPCAWLTCAALVCVFALQPPGKHCMLTAK